ncbi:MAG: Alpha-L-glutamate ligase, RimK family [Candidatus Collierbacteria bacterium GW2011_GWA1_42_60]|uniref:Alpha-L-glutamate ligase, RimK family n=1 Tax=Candidatus Collierbacteria bacterium GW2011_GWA2_42_17 TaxID=1618378 RepID=A0A0G0Z1D9_9BACT|nr:MAG: Alpha-L-glutamate ligase, RimK family [Candidatus Collierbacteria bacterium GW2011_GWB2_42_12]KKS42592.1 MAG: Alpha-L-glutamate ligase, RimK family [Candidatus Collierbacteria bacterium GW2011_GWA2_42_17]KKS61861.1 MAG: Alpha-L-glutamate ligase, RimK family [Candidatus Collierbacteria bacterium GW2011_GWF1_42_50]KKS62095.1 MAG: Alpha-L-glutamate ligase, RimK family [Candidatus Collierbacteria bacterium GW2011_GWE2_42_48]KKS64043.1 MAG: Alpha-L-glutamate ligase, RimK family [Candidatus C
MKIAVFYRIDFEETRTRMDEEAAKLGLELAWIRYRELKVVGTDIFWGETNIKDFDGWYFRAVGNELEWSKLLQFYARKHSIPVVDDYLLSEGPLRRFKSVMSWQLLDAGIKYPKSSFVESLNDLENELKNWEFPLIVKMSKGGRHGMGTFFLREFGDFKDLGEKLVSRVETTEAEGKKGIGLRGFLIQEYIANDGDFRVMTVGYKCIGGFKRMPKVEKLVLNQSEGSSVGLSEVPVNVVKVAEEAARVLGVEIAGTDLVISNKTGEVYLIEVNEAPQFKVFEKRTKINAPRKILEYCINKFEK